MELFQNVAEYYDELYPLSEAKKKFYDDESKIFKNPVKFLNIGCGTGSFEIYLSKKGADVTGLETCQDFINSANRKRRTMLMSVRFFQMSYLEMSRYLGKGFYNIISVLDGRLLYIHDPTLLAKFFYDCRTLLAENGKIIIAIPNFDKFTSETIELPVKESIRVQLFSKIITNQNGECEIFQKLKNSSGKIIPVIENVPVQKITKGQIKELAQKSGFTKFDFYSGFDYRPFSEDSDYLVAVLGL